MTRTETNMAYRTADSTRWQQLDFVVGIKINLSNNHPVPDICDDLKGKYPKDFLFRGWHPQCRCYATTILKTEAELESESSDSVNEVTDVPQGFTDWMDANAVRVELAKERGTLPSLITTTGLPTDT